MLRFFATVALVLAAACGGTRGAGGPGQPGSATPPVPVPENCDAPQAQAGTARAGDDQAAASAAVFALAECERIRLAAGKSDAGLATKVSEVNGLYDEAGGEGRPRKWIIGRHIRRADLLAAAAKRPGGGGDDWKRQAREGYEAGLAMADETDEETRLDTDIAEFVKAGCEGYRALGGQERRFKVCNPWKSSWR